MEEKEIFNEIPEEEKANIMQIDTDLPPEKWNITLIMEELIKRVGDDISDIFLMSGRPVYYKMGGRGTVMDPVWQNRIWTLDDMAEFLKLPLAKLVNTADIDTSLNQYGRRFRVNVCHRTSYYEPSKRGSTAVLRMFPDGIPDYDNFGKAMPDGFINNFYKKAGLVLITGKTNSGKSTTMAAACGNLVKNRPIHFLTMEDPVEFLYRPEDSMGLITQRDLGAGHSAGFHSALKAALRESPDVILMGEIRDHETAEIAMHAAMSGHLVLGTLHTATVTESLARVLSYFSPEEEQKVRNDFGSIIQAIICQHLIPTKTGGRQLVYEYLQCNAKTRALIRNGKDKEVLNEMLKEPSARLGKMRDKAVESGKVDVDLINEMIGELC